MGQKQSRSQTKMVSAWLQKGEIMEELSLLPLTVPNSYHSCVLKTLNRMPSSPIHRKINRSSVRVRPRRLQAQVRLVPLQASHLR